MFSWEDQRVRIAGTVSHPVTVALRKTRTQPPSVKPMLSRPGLKKKLSPVSTDVCPARVWCCDVEEHKRLIDIVRIRRE